MSADFYTEWLELPPGPRPPDYYTLLGVKVFCRDQDIIERAARRQLTRLDEFALYPDRDTRDAVQDMMNEVARARVDLVNPKRCLAYDRKLAQKLGVASPPAVEAETQNIPPPIPQAQVPIEHKPPLQAAPAAVAQPVVEEVIDVVAEFEARVLAHLQKWKLNKQEQRLLLAEAAALGVAADEALVIIERIDGVAEILAEKKHKRKLGLVLGLTAALVVVVITGLILFVVSSQRASRARDFLAAIEAARYLMERGDLDQAAIELSKARAIFPDAPMLEEAANKIALKRKAMEEVFTDVLSRVRSLTDRGDLEQAATELARAKAIFPYDSRVKEAANEVALKRKAVEKAFTGMLSRARSLMERGKLDQVANELARAKAMLPSDPRVKKVVNEMALKRKAIEKAFTGRLSRARSLTARGELDQAATELARAKAIFPHDSRVRKAAKEMATAYYDTGRAHFNFKQYTDAIAAYDKAVALNPGYADAYLFMGLAYYYLKQEGDAIVAYKKAVAIKPDAVTYYNIGLAHHSLKQYTDAIAAHKKAVAIKPDYARAKHRMGLAYGSLGQYTDAIVAFKAAVAIQPDASSYHYMGITYGYLKQYTDAIAAYKKAVAIKPYAVTYYKMGHVYRDLKQHADAIVAYEKAVAIQPDAVTYYNIGIAHHSLKQYTDAIAAYKKAVAIKPDASSYHYMGLAYYYLRQYDDAVAAYKKAVAIKPDAVTYHNMGLDYVILKKHAFAIAAYKKAIALKPNYADAYCSMGVAYDGLKRYTDALAAYKKAIALEPTGKTADRAREAVRRINKY
jgi:tetratricopeptide (TPR) repeat protein